MAISGIILSSVTGEDVIDAIVEKSAIADDILMSYCNLDAK
jgi:hypothetical protein